MGRYGRLIWRGEGGEGGEYINLVYISRARELHGAGCAPSIDKRRQMWYIQIGIKNRENDNGLYNKPTKFA